MPTKRKCRKCGNPSLQPVSRIMCMYFSTYNYKCSECGHKTSLIPMGGGLGLQVSVFLLLELFIGFRLFSEMPIDNYIDYIFLILLVLNPLVFFLELFRHKANPVVRGAKKQEIEMLGTNKGMFLKLINYIEVRSFFVGFLIPIIFISALVGLTIVVMWSIDLIFF